MARLTIIRRRQMPRGFGVTRNTGANYMTVVNGDILIPFHGGMTRTAHVIRRNMRLRIRGGRLLRQMAGLARAYHLIVIDLHHWLPQHHAVTGLTRVAGQRMTGAAQLAFCAGHAVVTGHTPGAYARVIDLRTLPCRRRGMTGRALIGGGDMIRGFTLGEISCRIVTTFTIAHRFGVVYLARSHHPGGTRDMALRAGIATINRDMPIALAGRRHTVMATDTRSHGEIEFRMIKLRRHPRRCAMTIVTIIRCF